MLVYVFECVSVKIKIRYATESYKMFIEKFPLGIYVWCIMYA